MHIIIDHDSIKRDIHGPYQICGDAKDFELLGRAIQEFLDCQSTYGWIEVHEHTNTCTNQKPIAWRSEG